MERLTGLDAAFLSLETPSNHMHLILVAVLDPTDVPGGFSAATMKRLIEQRIDTLPPFRRRDRARAVRPPPPAVDRGPRLRPGLPRAPGRGARTRRRARARGVRRRGRGMAARPRPTAVADVGRRGPRARTRRAGRQGAPRRGRRRVGRRGARVARRSRADPRARDRRRAIEAVGSRPRPERRRDDRRVDGLDRAPARPDGEGDRAPRASRWPASSRACATRTCTRACPSPRRGSAGT